MILLPDYSTVEKVLRQQARGAAGRLGAAARCQMKERIMQSVRGMESSHSLGYSPLTILLKKSAISVKPEPAFVVDLREKLAIVYHLDTRQRDRRARRLNRMPLRSVLAQLFVGTLPRRLTAAGVLSFFLIALVGNLALSPTVSYAHYESIVEEVSGDVVVERDGKVLSAYKGFILKENDVVRTIGNAKASVRFLDQTIGRLAENTSLGLVAQRVNQLNKSQTVVEVTLDYGRLWTRVINLIDNNSRFEVKTPSVTAVAKRRAAFDIAISPQGTSRVTAVHNRVDVRVASASNVVETTIVKGFSAEVQSQLPMKAIVAPTVDNSVGNSIDQESVTQPDAWVTENLSKDVTYIEEVKEASKAAVREQAGLVPGNALYALEQFTDSTSIALSIDPIERNKKLLAVAEKKLGEAAIMLERGDANGAQLVLDEFLHLIGEVSNWIQSLELVKLQEIIEVKTSLEALLAQSNKQFSLVLPTDQTYKIKETLSRAALLVAHDPVAQTEEKLNTATEKLIEAHDLAEQGNTPAATQKIEEYKDTVQEVVGTLEKLEPSNKERAVEALLESKKEDIKTLEVITESHKQPTSGPSVLQEQSTLKEEGVIPDVHEEIQVQVSEAKKEALTQIGEALLDSQTRVSSPELIQKIEAIRRVDINGKTLLELQMVSGKLLIRTNSTTITIPPDNDLLPMLRNAASEESEEKESQITTPLKEVPEMLSTDQKLQ